jgi:hypothetical protein
MNETMENRCNLFAEKSRLAPKWAFTKILEFLQFQKERVEGGETSPVTLRNFVKAIKLFWLYCGGCIGTCKDDKNSISYCKWIGCNHLKDKKTICLKIKSS